MALLIHEAMKDAAVRGYQYWNWGGTWLTQSGVYDFKKKWGTKDYPYYYYTQVNNEKILYLRKEDLLETFPGFFVVPFNQLKAHGRSLFPVRELELRTRKGRYRPHPNSHPPSGRSIFFPDAWTHPRAASPVPGADLGRSQQDTHPVAPESWAP